MHALHASACFSAGRAHMPIAMPHTQKTIPRIRMRVVRPAGRPRGACALQAGLALAALVALFAFCAPCQAAPALSGARMVFTGDYGKSARNTDILAVPGVRMGMDFIPEGSPQGASVVLEVKLTRPEDGETREPLRWLLPGRIGYRASAVWEFAYPWEVQPGLWTMTASCEGRELARASFVVRAPGATDMDSPRKAPAQPKESDATQAAAAPVPKPPPPAASGGPDAARQEAAGVLVPQAFEEALSSLALGHGAQTFFEAAGGQPQGGQNRTGHPARPQDGSGAVAASAASAHSTKPQEKAEQQPAGEGRGRVVYVLVAGSYSGRDRALRMAQQLRRRGVKACIMRGRDGRKEFWRLVAGWREGLEEARNAKESLEAAVGEIFIAPTPAEQFRRDLRCP